MGKGRVPMILVETPAPFKEKWQNEPEQDREMITGFVVISFFVANRQTRNRRTRGVDGEGAWTRLWANPLQETGQVPGGQSHSRKDLPLCL